MSEISSEWDTVLAAIRSKQQEPTYMASALLGLIACLDGGECTASDPISIELILGAQETLLNNAACDQVTPAFQGVFHLSGTADVWAFHSNGELATFDDLPRNKPRSAAQLLERADQLVVRSPLRPQLLGRTSRSQLALAIGEHLRESASEDDSDSAKLSKLTTRLFS